MIVYSGYIKENEVLRLLIWVEVISSKNRKISYLLSNGFQSRNDIKTRKFPTPTNSVINSMLWNYQLGVDSDSMYEATHFPGTVSHLGFLLTSKNTSPAKRI